MWSHTSWQHEHQAVPSQQRRDVATAQRGKRTWVCTAVNLRSTHWLRSAAAAAAAAGAVVVFLVPSVFRHVQVSASTAIMLAVGRLAFLPQQRRGVEKSAAVAGPKTTGGRPFPASLRNVS